MSSSKGNSTRTRPQKHQNRTAFKNNLHDTSNKTKFLNSLEVTDVCKRCKDIIEWKIKYKKYKPLTAPKKCVGCEQKAVKFAYHVLCTNCAKEKNVCSKCCKKVEIEETINKEDEGAEQNVDVQQLLKQLPERKRRTLIRYINKQKSGEELSQEKVMKYEEIVAHMDKFSLEDDDDDDLDGLSDSDLDSESGTEQ